MKFFCLFVQTLWGEADKGRDFMIAGDSRFVSTLEIELDSLTEFYIP